jgi:YidC/Oxa1 family membrane protein insertase
MSFLTNYIFQALVFFYQLLGSNFGLAIIALTLSIRAVLVPVTLPSLKSAKKMQSLKPHLDKLKKKHGNDKAKLQQAQLALYKEHGVNPAAGCLPQIVQLVILIALYQVFLQFLKTDQINGHSINLSFLWLDLSKPDPFYILPVLAGLTQLVFSAMMQSGIEHHPEKVSKKEDKKDDLDMATAMTQQMMFMMPVMTTIIALRFPSGLALYWVITTVFSLVQQYFISGWGGLILYRDKAFKMVTNLSNKNYDRKSKRKN